MSFFKSEKFKALKNEWYSKLKESGFDDVEQNDADENLKQWHAFYFQARHDPDAFSYKEVYFQNAQSFLEAHEFETEFQRIVWDLHCEGGSLRQIAYALSSKVWLVRQTIMALEELMKAQPADE